ncbi:MAG: hypothetical protein Q7R73_04415 [bacterium]|nr:hypothetical protein [bacterium]
MNKENFGKIEQEKIFLGVRNPDGDKNYMVFFEGRTSDECIAYNIAIREILEREGFLPFHQVGVKPEGNNEPGYHAWEVWRKNVTKEKLESLLPEIAAKAQAYLKE